MDLTHDDLIFLINKAYPDAVHGRDFMVGQPVDDNSFVRTGSAFVASWNLEAELPTPAEIEALYDIHDTELLAARATRQVYETRNAVDAERDRRIADGFLFDGVLYQSRPGDIDKISRWAASARSAIESGAVAGDYRWHGQNYDFAWIAAGNTTHKLDAPAMVALGEAVLAHEQAHILAARQIKDMDPIPADYEHDSYWPD